MRAKIAKIQRGENVVSTLITMCLQVAQQDGKKTPDVHKFYKDKMLPTNS